MVEEKRYLDLFGGTGAVGIEALSRDAAEAVFCERDRKALETLRRNLEDTGTRGPRQGRRRGCLRLSRTARTSRRST